MSGLVVDPFAVTPVPPAAPFSLRDPEAEARKRMERAARIESAVLDGVDTILTPQQKEMRRTFDAMAPDKGAASRARIAHTLFLAGETGRSAAEIGDAYEYWKALYARQNFDGVDSGNEAAFGAKVKDLVTKRRDFRVQAQSFHEAGVRDALTLEPKDFMARAARLTDIYGADTKLGPQDGKKLRETYLLARQQAEGKIAALRPVAREVWNELQKDTVKTGDAEEYDARERAINLLEGVSDGDRPMVLQLLKARLGDDKLESPLAAGVVRGFLGMMQGAVAQMDVRRIDGYLRDLSVEEPKVDASLDTPEKIKARMVSGLGLITPSEYGAPRTRTLSPDEVEGLRADFDRQVKRHDIANEAQSIFDNNVLPVDLSGLGGELRFDVGNSIGAMAPMMVPLAGVVISQSGYANEEYLRLRQQGVEFAPAKVASEVTGGLVAGIERVSFLFNFVPTSTLGKVATNLLTGGSSPALLAGARGMAFGIGKRVVLTQGVEYGEEIAQAAAPMFTAAIAEPLGLDLPQQAQLTAELERFKAEGGLWRPRVFAAVAAMTLLPAGAHGAVDTVNARAEIQGLLADPDYAKAMGIKPEQAIVIAAMPEGERLGAYLESFPTRDASTPVAKAAAESVARKAQEQAEWAQTQVAQAEAAGVRIRRTDAGTYEVQDTTTGTTLAMATAEEASATMRHVMLERGLLQEERWLNAADKHIEMMKPGRTIDVSNIETDLLEELEKATAAGREKDVLTIWERADQYRLSLGKEVLDRDRLNPDSRNALADMTVYGQSVTAVREGVARSISKVMAGGDSLDLLEEQAENDYREAVAYGRVDKETMKAIIKRLEDATGDQYQFVDSDLGVTEAWSRIVRLYATGTQNSKGNAITKGARGDAAAYLQARRRALRQAEAKIAGGPTGTKASDLREKRRRLREAEANGVTPGAFAKLREYYDQAKAQLGQVARLMKARDAGQLDDLETMIRESVGLKEQDTYDGQLTKEMEATEASLKPPDSQADSVTSSMSVGMRVLPDTNDFAAEDTETQMSFAISPRIWDHNKDLRRPKSLKERMASEYGATLQDNILYRPDRYYRVIDDNAWADFQEVGYFRPNPNSKTNDGAGYPVLYAATGGQAGRYKGRYVIEVDPTGGKWTDTGSSGYVTAAIGSVTKDSAVRVFERQTDGSYRVLLDNIGDQALIDPADQMSGSYSVGSRAQPAPADTQGSYSIRHILGTERGDRTVMATADLALRRKQEKEMEVAGRKRFQLLKKLNKKKPKLLDKLLKDGVEKSAEDFVERVKGILAAHPASDGWANLVFTGIDPKGEPKFKTVPYSFDRDGGKGLAQGKAAWKKRVDGLGTMMTEEVRALFLRAKNGDTAAQNILSQASWYREMRTRLRREFGGLGDLFADLLGGTSPNTPVKGNWDNALDVLRRATRGDWDAMMPKWEAWAEEVERGEMELQQWVAEKKARGITITALKRDAEYNERRKALSDLRKLPQEMLPRKENGALYGFNGRNVVRGLVGLWRTVREKDDSIGRGATAPKALNFSGNLIGFRSGATIDVWAARLLQRLAGGLRIPSVAEGGVDGSMLPSGETTGTFRLGQDAFQDAVDKIRADGDLNQNALLASLNPDDLQAIVWFLEKEVWTINDWTSVAGEGGSFEFEADLAGVADTARVKELRKIIDSKLSTKDQKTAAMADLKAMMREADSFVGGISVQQSAYTQGEDYVPGDAHMEQVQNALKLAAYSGNPGSAVLAMKAYPSEGRFGTDVERAFDVEVVGREDFNPDDLWTEMLRQSRDNNQDAVYLARKLRAAEAFDPARHRPGIEVYFKTPLKTKAEVDAMVAKIIGSGMEFMTLIVDPTPRASARAGAMPAVVGVRSLFLPEFNVRFGDNSLVGADEATVTAAVEAKADDFTALGEALLKQVDGINFANTFWYDTAAAFSHEYDTLLGGAVTDTGSGGPDTKDGAAPWKGISNVEAIERAAARNETSSRAAERRALRGEPGADARGLDQDAVGSMSVGPRRDLMEMTPVTANSSAFPKEADVRKLREIGEAQYAKLVGPTWTNERDGRQFRFTLQQFGKPRSHSADPRIMKLIPSLPSLMENAVLLETELELDKIKYKNIDAWHTYAARVRLDGQPLIVQLTTFEQNGMEMVSLYHDHNVLWEEALSWGQKNSENLPKGPTDPVTNRAVMMEALAKSKLFQLLSGDNSNPASSMSIGPRAKLDAVQARLDQRLENDPEARRKVAAEAARRLRHLETDWTTERLTWKGDKIKAISEPRTRKSLDKEQAFREAAAVERELAARGLNGQDIARSKDSKDYEMWQRFQESKHLLMGKGMNEWEAAALAEAGTSKWRKDFVATIKEVSAIGKAEGAEWRKGVDAVQAKDYHPRAALLRDMRTLDAIVGALPPEIRYQVGGQIKLASLATDEARADEIARRIDRIAPLLERHLQKEFTASLEKLLERAKPMNAAAGEKMTGKLGPEVQHLMNVVREAYRWTGAKTEAALAALDVQLASGDLTPEQQALAERERELVNLVGGWLPETEDSGRLDTLGRPIYTRVSEGASAAQMEAAYKAVEETYENGYQDWQAKILAKRLARQAIRDSLMVDTGKTGEAPERDAKAIADLGWTAKLRNMFLSLSSFEEVAQYVFGRDSVQGLRMVDQEREAAYAYEDAVQLMGEMVQAHFAALGGDPLAGERIRFALSQKDKKVGKRTLAEMEIMQAALMWQQADGQRHMAGKLDESNQPIGPWHYDQAWMDEAMAKLSPEGLATLAFIRSTYAAEYGPLNAIYRARHGVDLPQNANYAPVTVAPVQAKAGEMVDPVGGGSTTGSILTPGSLRTRSRSAIAEPDFKDALQVMLAHHKQMEHWKAYYDFAVEAQAVLGNRELGNAVESKSGAQGKLILRKWIDHFAQGGTRDAGAALALNRELGGAAGRGARMALVGRAGTLIIQSTQLGAAAAEMPTGAYLLRLGKLLSGHLGWKAAMDSSYIQRRLTQLPPIVQQAMAGLSADNPTVVKHAVARLGTLISGADALFTAGTYAMVLDYQLGEAAKLGLPGPEAAAWAHKAAERSVERVAQPTRAGTRSLFENTSTSPMAKLGWAFASEARQKIAMAAWAAQNAKADPARAVRVAMVVWGVGGLMAAVLRNAWRDLRDDDDDEVLDAKHWKLSQLVASTIAGPLQGIPGVGEALQSAIAVATGGWDSSGNLFSGLGKGVGAGMDLLSGDFLESAEPLEDVMKDAEAVLMALGLFSENLASASSIAHVVRDGAALIDNAHDSASEKAAMEKRKLAREKREAKEASK